MLASMKQNLIPLLAFPFIFASCATPPAPQPLAESTAEASVAGAPSATERTLLDALNAARVEAGKRPVAYSAKLSSYAQSASGGAASASELPTEFPNNLHRVSGFAGIGRLQGVLKDRGPSTGGGFVSYWKQDNREMLFDDWSVAGVGVAKGEDGRLFAVVLFGSAGRTDVMRR